MEVGVPEKQAEMQAELMVEAFVYNMDSLVTRDYLDARFAEQETRIEARFAEQDARIDTRFAEQNLQIEARSAEQDARFEERFELIDQRFADLESGFGVRLDAGLNELQALFVAQNASNDISFAQIKGQFTLHNWILGAIAASTVLPTLHSLLIA
jgi:hypothetical protein